MKFDVSVLDVNHYATGTTPPKLWRDNVIKYTNMGVDYIKMILLRLIIPFVTFKFLQYYLITVSPERFCVGRAELDKIF